MSLRDLGAAVFFVLGFVLLEFGHGATPPVTASKNDKRRTSVRVLTALSTPLKSGHPVLFLSGDVRRAGRVPDPLASRLVFPADQRYSKWSVIFETPVRVESVEVKTCPGTKRFADGVELFLGYNEKRLFSDGGRNVVKFKVKFSTRSLTLGFLESQGLCLESIDIRTGVEWMRPRVLPATGSLAIADGTVGSSSRMLPVGEKFKQVGDRKSGEWQLHWENPLIVESLRIWNGNQNTGEAYTQNARVHELQITTDEGKPFKVSLADQRYFQQLDFEDPKAIRKIDLRSLSTYPGTLEGEPVLGEVQLLAGGETWIPAISTGALPLGESNESVQARAVRERGFGDLLDRELRATERGDIWKFRIRSDGTFFARVFVDRARVARAWSASGSWTVTAPPITKADPKTKSTPPLRTLLRALGTGSNGTAEESAEATAKNSAMELPGLSLAFAGAKMATADIADSLPCGNHCFSSVEDRGPSAQLELPVAENIEFQRDGRSRFFLRNRTPAEKRTLDFGDLKVRIHSLYD